MTKIIWTTKPQNFSNFIINKFIMLVESQILHNFLSSRNSKWYWTVYVKRGKDEWWYENLNWEAKSVHQKNYLHSSQNYWSNHNSCIEWGLTKCYLTRIHISKYYKLFQNTDSLGYSQNIQIKTDSFLYE